MAAEYMAASDTCNEIYDSREALAFYGADQTDRNGRVRCSILYCDSVSAAHCAQEPKVHQKTKSIRTKYHSIRSHCSKGPDKCIELVYIHPK